MDDLIFYRLIPNVACKNMLNHSTFKSFDLLIMRYSKRQFIILRSVYRTANRPLVYPYNYRSSLLS